MLETSKANRGRFATWKEKPELANKDGLELPNGVLPPKLKPPVDAAGDRPKPVEACCPNGCGVDWPKRLPPPNAGELCGVPNAGLEVNVLPIPAVSMSRLNHRPFVCCFSIFQRRLEEQLEPCLSSFFFN